ncbi:uncharacterized protein LOC143215011 isoform X3 [Lasioglossum baleicum]|uniref:uncharacterized protein LOC143215011 isoform X3 n=1 Tax=Lasioglossum baleicum TaxID=434251 RepID=UPI003FCE8997
MKRSISRKEKQTCPSRYCVQDPETCSTTTVERTVALCCFLSLATGLWMERVLPYRREYSE